MKEVGFVEERTASLGTIWFRILFILVFNILIPIVSIIYVSVNGYKDLLDVLIFGAGLFLYMSIALTITFMMLFVNKKYC